VRKRDNVQKYSQINESLQITDPRTSEKRKQDTNILYITLPYFIQNLEKRRDLANVLKTKDRKKLEGNVEEKEH
jgi:hypothetical protein